MPVSQFSPSLILLIPVLLLLIIAVLLMVGIRRAHGLGRIGGRYLSILQEREAMRSVHALNDDALFDLWTLKHRFPRMLPFVDADYGSGAYLPMVGGGRFDLFLNPRGGLVAKPADEATRQKLHAAGW